MATDDYAKIEHDMAAMLRESFPVTWPPGLATKLSLQFVDTHVCFIIVLCKDNFAELDEILFKEEFPQFLKFLESSIFPDLERP